MGVSKNMSTPKWMVKIMENPIKMDDLGVPLFSETSINICMLHIYIYIYIGYIPFSMGSNTGGFNQLGIHRGT